MLCPPETAAIGSPNRKQVGSLLGNVNFDLLRAYHMEIIIKMQKGIVKKEGECV